MHFVTYKRFRDDQELKELSDTRNDTDENSGASKEGDKCSDHVTANKITEWQAGWNVTNAIQVLQLI